MNNIPQGYKKTKLGIIPKDWKEIKLSEFIKEKNIYCNDEIIKIGSLTIEKGVIPKPAQYEREHLVKDMNDAYKLVSQYDFVYNPMNLRFGALALHNKSEKLKVSAYYNIFSIDEDIVNLDFIYSYLKSEKVMNYYNRMATGSLEEKKRVHFKEFLKFDFPLPPLKEQEKIAKILTSCDSVIDKQKLLIKEKEQLKKGLLQKLLNADLRFDGFTDKWKVVKLGEIFSERIIRYKDVINNDYKELLSVGINSGITKRSDNVDKDNSSEDKSNYKIVEKDDIVYNTMRMWQGASGISKYKGFVSPAYTVIYLKNKCNIDFFVFLFKQHRLVFDFYRYSQGLTSDTWNIKFQHFSKVKIRIPLDVKEQERISEILNIADKEIKLLKKELKELKEQKKGLMQLLLTGKVRVKV